jgi:hypothetical protein
VPFATLKIDKNGKNSLIYELPLCYDADEIQIETQSANYCNEYVSPFAEPTTPQNLSTNKKED